MTQIQLILGVPQSGKTHRCLSAFAPAFAVNSDLHSAGRCLWLTPAREARQEVLRRLLPLTDGVAFQPNVLTFDRFAERVLNETGHPGRAITSLERRTVLRGVIGEFVRTDTFQYFGRIAETPGFLDVVAGFIAELKRAEIWPDTFLSACQAQFGKSRRQRDAELGAVYERYQTILQEKNWYDAEGRFWLARTAMQDSNEGFWKSLSLVVVDGFSDFTRTQQEMLEQLAVGSQQLLLTLPMEQPVHRQELFAKPQTVLKLLQERFAKCGSVKTVNCDFPLPKQPGGLAQIQRRLFENPRLVPRIADAGGIEILAATGDSSERAAVALGIKRHLARGVSPNEIVIGLRSVALSGQAWQTYLSAAGIPSWCEAAVPWSRSPYLKALFGVLQMEIDDWTFPRLQSVLNSSLFRLRIADLNWQPQESPAYITGWLRRLKLHSRRSLILKGLARRRDHLGPKDTEQDRDSLALSSRVLAELSDATELLRRSHALDGWADVLGQLTSRLGLAAGGEQDRLDADQLQSLLRTAARIEAELSDAPLKRTLAEMLELLRDIVQAGSPPDTTRPEGRVRIVGAETLRHLQPNYVFLVELTEDAFPSKRSDDCLYSEAERQQLHQSGLLLSHRELHQREEMLLFYQAVTRATVQLTLSYSQVNQQGHETYASPYVAAVRELFDPAIQPQPVGHLDPLPNEDEILTPTDLRLAAVVHARNKDKGPGWWKLLLENDSTRDTAQNVLAAADVAALRFHTQGFTPYEGRLVHPLHHAELAQRFNNERQFSATELESYATCPFRFWVSHILKLEPLAAPEVVTDYSGRGNLVHDILAKLSPEIGSDASAIAERFRELVDERLERQSTDDDLQEALLRVETDLLHRWAEAFGEQHNMYRGKSDELQLTDLRTLQEVPFGAARDADAESPQERFPPLVLGNDELTIRLGGRIDRVDVGQLAEQTVFTLIDYKTGKRPEFSLPKVATGVALQLALYTLAVMRLGIAGPNAVPLWMGYWSVKQDGFTPIGKRGSKWPPLEQAVLSSLEKLLAELVPNAVAGMRGGEFVVENDDPRCTGGCAYHTVCRVNHIRPLADRLNKHRTPLVSLPQDGG